MKPASGHGPRTPFPTPFLALAALLTLGLAGCGDDGTGNEDGETVTIEGTITNADGVPQANLFAHIVYGPAAAPVGVASDESDGQGLYSVTGTVPADQCHAVQLWVLEGGTFSPAADRLAREVVGRCGTSALDLQLDGTGPINH